MTNEEAEKHKFYSRARSAFEGTSFRSESRAVRSLEWYERTKAKLIESGAEWALEKFDVLYLKSLASMSRIVSPMIVGPAKFPVERMEKLRRFSMNADERLADFVNKALNPPAKRKELDYGLSEYTLDLKGLAIRQNTEANRLQLVFEEKPSSELISLLKKNGFIWSPKNKAWQRQLTPMALGATQRILPEIKKMLSKSETGQ